MIERTYWFCEYLDDKVNYDFVEDEERYQTDPEQANCISSLLTNGMHAPTVDIDLPAALHGQELSVDGRTNWSDVAAHWSNAETQQSGTSIEYDEDYLVDPAREVLSELDFAKSLSVKASRIVIELVHPAILLPSRTPDHYHLYVQQEMSWDDYSEVLWRLTGLGIVERRYLEYSDLAEMSFLRKPPEGMVEG